MLGLPIKRVMNPYRWGGAHEFPKVHHVILKIPLFGKYPRTWKRVFLEISHSRCGLKNHNFFLSSGMSLSKVGQISEISRRTLQIFAIFQGK